MPLAVTHVLLTIIIVDLYRDYVTRHKKYFSLHTIMIAGVAGLLPDIDIPLSWILDYLGIQIELLQHGGIAHTPFFGLIFLIPAFILHSRKKYKESAYFFVLCFGILLHLFLDIVIGGGGHNGIMLFWPLLGNGYYLGIVSSAGLANLPAALDAIILILWLWHEEKKHKIKDFI